MLQFLKKTDLELKGFLLGGPIEIGLEGVELVILGSKVDMGLSSFPYLEEKLVVFRLPDWAVLLFWLHPMYYKRILTFDHLNLSLKKSC